MFTNTDNRTEAVKMIEDAINHWQFEKPDPTPKQSESIPDDDLFAESNEHAEEFGVKAPRPIHERIVPSSARETRRWQRFKKGNNNSAPEPDQASSSTNRKRKIQYQSVESLASTESHHSHQKRSKKKKKKQNKSENAPELLPQFSHEQLYKAAIPKDLSAEETGERIAHELGEVDSVPMKFAVTEIGTELALQLFDLTVQTEKNGGLRIKFGSRRRTPGGVFFQMLRNSDQVSKEVKDKIYTFSRDYFVAKGGSKKKEADA